MMFRMFTAIMLEIPKSINPYLRADNYFRNIMDKNTICW